MVSYGESVPLLGPILRFGRLSFINVMSLFAGDLNCITEDSQDCLEKMVSASIRQASRFLDFLDLY